MEIGGDHIRRPSHVKRMQWYYERIIDCMVANPQMTISEIAAEINRSPGYISTIINSDMFKAAYEQRRLQFTTFHDIALVHKTQAIANATLDAILENLEKKRDKIPLGSLHEINKTAMERLGYGAPKVGVPTTHVTVNTGAQVVLPPTVTRADIEEARMAVRQTQAQRLPPPQPALPPQQGAPSAEVQIIEGETVDAS